MRDPNRIPEVLIKLGDFWNRHPDLRLGQIVSIASTIQNKQGDPFNMEDDKFLAALEQIENIK